MARPRLDEQERRALGQRVRIAAELRLGRDSPSFSQTR